MLPEHSTRSNVLLRHHWTSHGDSFRLTLLGYSGKWRSSDQIPLRATRNGTLDRYGNLDPTDGGDSSRASLSFDATLGGTSGTTRINLHAITYRLNLFSNFTYFLDDPVNGDQFNQRDGRAVFGGSIVNIRPFTSAGVTTEITTGAQLRGDEIGDLGIRHTVARRYLSTVRDDDVQELSAGLFARVETRWNDWLLHECGSAV
jgi:hypothetical protein